MKLIVEVEQWYAQPPATSHQPPATRWYTGYARGYRSVSILVAVLLLVAVILKLFTSDRLVSSPVINLIPAPLLRLVPLFELALAGLLIRGIFRFGSWLAATGLFLVFAYHNLALVKAGRPSCGCFGDTAAVPPIWTLVLDLAVVLALVICRPRWSGWPRWTPVGRFATTAATVGCVVLAVAGGVAVYRYGSVEVAVAAAQGTPVTLAATKINLGRVKAGTVVPTKLVVANHSDVDVQIAMSESGCGCMKVEGLPILIPPGVRTVVELAITAPDEPGTMTARGRLRTSAGNLTFTTTAVVTPAEDSP